MIDKELLEYAAKAVGMTIKYNYLGMQDARYPWNPLDDDSDAFQLAIKLRLMLSWHEPRDLVVIWWNDGTRKEVRETWTEAHDSCACSRRAIVRAAAEIGKEMK